MKVMLSIFKFSILLLLSISLAKSDVSHSKETNKQTISAHHNARSQRDLSKDESKILTSSILPKQLNPITISDQNGHELSRKQRKAPNSQEYWDIRNNIPGEPGTDYPIYSVPPESGFSCYNRHDGYYADVEARCQVFRVCANTDLTGRGFAFLCPNGTLFNQKYFVCDWYFHVDCTQSENFYYKNSELGNTIGSLTDIMNTVQQMVDYTKQNLGNTGTASVSSGTQRPDVVSRPGISGHNNNNFGATIPTVAPSSSQFATRPAATARPQTSGNVFVSNLGELTNQFATNRQPLTATSPSIVGISSGQNTLAPNINQRPSPLTGNVNAGQNINQNINRDAVVNQQVLIQNQLTGQTNFPAYPENFLGVQPPSQAYVSDSRTSSRPQTNQGKAFNQNTFKDNQSAGQIDQNSTQTKLVLPFVVNSLGEVRPIFSGEGDLLSQSFGGRRPSNGAKLNQGQSDSKSVVQSGSADLSGQTFGQKIVASGVFVGQSIGQPTVRPVYSGSGDLLGQTFGQQGRRPSSANQSSGTSVTNQQSTETGQIVGNIQSNAVFTATGQLIQTFGQNNRRTPIYSGSGDLLGQTIGQQTGSRSQTPVNQSRSQANQNKPVYSGSGDLLSQSFGSKLNKPIYSGSGDLLGQTVIQSNGNGQKVPVYSGSGDLLGQSFGQKQPTSVRGNSPTITSTFYESQLLNQKQFNQKVQSSSSTVPLNPVYSGEGDLLGQSFGSRRPTQNNSPVSKGQTTILGQSVSQSVSRNVSYSEQKSVSTQKIQPQNSGSKQILPLFNREQNVITQRPQQQSPVLGIGERQGPQSFQNAPVVVSKTAYSKTNFRQEYSQRNNSQSFSQTFYQNRDNIPLPTTYTYTERTPSTTFYRPTAKSSTPARGYLPSITENTSVTKQRKIDQDTSKQVYTYPSDEKESTTLLTDEIDINIDADLTTQNLTNRDVSKYLKQQRSDEIIEVEDNDTDFSVSINDIVDFNRILQDSEKNRESSSTEVVNGYSNASTDLKTTQGKLTKNDVLPERNGTNEKSTNLLLQGVQLSLYEKRYFRQNRTNYINQLKNETARPKPKPKDSKVSQTTLRGTRNTNSIKFIFERAKNRTNDYRVLLQQRFNASNSSEQKINIKRNIPVMLNIPNRSLSEERNSPKVAGFINNKVNSSIIKTTDPPPQPPPPPPLPLQSDDKEIDVDDHPTQIKIPTYLTRLFKRVVLSDNTKPRTTTTPKSTSTTKSSTATPMDNLMTNTKLINRLNSSKLRDQFRNFSFRKYISIPQIGQSQQQLHTRAVKSEQSTSPTPQATYTNNNVIVQQRIEDRIDRSDKDISSYQYIDTRPSTAGHVTASIANIPKKIPNSLHPTIRNYYPAAIQNHIDPQKYYLYKQKYTPSTPRALPSVVHPISFTASVRQTEQQQNRHKEHVIVKIVPSTGWYLNNESERKSYFEAVSRGLLNENGDIFVNNIQRLGLGKSLNGGLDIDDFEDEEGNYFKGPNSYWVPLSSVGKLACDSDSVNNIQVGDESGYIYTPPCPIIIDYIK